MIISVIMLTENNLFKKIKFNVENKNLYYLQVKIFNIFKIPIKNQIWYENNNEINYTFNKWNQKDKYNMFIKKNLISFYIKTKNKIIQTPQISTDTKIKDLRNILLINDLLLYKNNILQDNKTLDYYNLSDNIILNAFSIIKYNNLNYKYIN